MAQLRAEVRPLVSNMPTEGFAMQTGGSARRRVVPFDTSTNSYKVTGVPGHTHNASAVCSVLVDNTERSNVPIIINDHFAYQAVNVPGDRFTDSHEFDEPEYDRALERGIGEIAIIPENCHQEIREPARAIGELRTLVMPKDKRDTLTYVEEVGGFVDVSTGEVPDPEPLYPDVVVDLFHSYALPVAAAVAVQNGDLRTGTGNTAFADGELRFVGLDPTNGNWSRAAGAGHGSSFVPLRQVGGNLATVDGQPWEGVITMRWDPNDKHYICNGFEAVFTQMYETTQHPDAATVVTQTHNNFEIVFPTITTTVSEDGQCLFTGSERPLRDAPAANEGYEQIRCEIDQSNLHKAIAGSFLYLRVYPFRIATGFSSAINGPAIGTNFWQHVRNTEIASTLQTIQSGGAANAAARNSLYQNDGADPPAQASNRMLQVGARAFYANRDHAFKTDANLPTIFSRNAVAGTSYSMLPPALSLAGQGFGPVFGIAADANAYDPDLNDAANYRGFSFVPAAVQALYEAGGHVQAQLANAAWTLAANYPYRHRVSRRIDQTKLFSRTEFATDAQSFAQHIIDTDTVALANNADDVRRPTVTITRINDATGLAHAPNPQTDTVLFQSEAHWTTFRLD